MLKITLKCPKHPKYNPEKDREGGIKGNCKDCYNLFTFWKFSLDYWRKN